MARKWSQELVDQECVKIIKRMGYLPSCYELTQMGANDITVAIARYGGGMKATRKRIGWLGRVKDRRFVKKHTLLEIQHSAQALYDEQGHFPSVGWMQANGYVWLSNLIARRFGGTRKFQEMRGFEKSTMVSGSDGRLWDSKGEASISNFFIDHNIAHERGHPYPDNSRRTFDFYLPDYNLHMELWGDFETTGPIPVRKEYESRRAAKEQFHAESDLNTLCIEYKDAINNNRLKEIFTPYLPMDSCPN